MEDDPASWATGRLLSHVARHLERQWNTHLEQWDLNHASLPVLLALLRSEHSQRELAAASGVTEQTMSRIVGRLERHGYVSRTASRADARRHVVQLTETGRAVALEAASPETGEEIATRGLAPEEVGRLRDLLLLMVRAAADETPPTTS